MKDILQEIIQAKSLQVERQKQQTSHAELEKLIRPRTKISMQGSLAESKSGIIAEFKRRSPSKGWINREADPQLIVPSYAMKGAAALSILTDEPYFGGTTADIEAVREKVTTPILRKEFIIDEWQVLESRLVGADAILLIAAALSEAQCRSLSALAHELDMEVLLEIHSENEMEYINPCIDMIGVNNRNLGTFITDTGNSFRMAGKLPADMLRISESGISNPATVKELRQAGFRGFLIGECFMRDSSPAEALEKFIEETLQC